MNSAASESELWHYIQNVAAQKVQMTNLNHWMLIDAAGLLKIPTHQSWLSVMELVAP
jgi:hypothetical protein